LRSAFRLALLLGKTVSELDITWDEFVYWQAFLRLEPPDQGDNQRTAALLAQITNMSGKSLKKGKSVSIDDFLGKPKRQSMEDQIAFMKGLGRG
jgi:hypothetical protein